MPRGVNRHDEAQLQRRVFPASSRPGAPRAWGAGADVPCVLSPTDKHADLTISEGGRRVVNTVASGSYAVARATVGRATGTWVYEIDWRVIVTAGASLAFGFANSSHLTNDWLGSSNNSFGWYPSNGSMWIGGGTVDNGNEAPRTFAAGLAYDRMQFVFDATNRTVVLCKNGIALTPVVSIAALTGTQFPALAFATLNDRATLNFGDHPFGNSGPNGYAGA
jgi:hypothetical protein